MSHRPVRVESDRHGRLRFVRGGHHRPVETMTNEGELLDTIDSLTARLSFAEHNTHQIRQQYQDLANEHHNCRGLREQVHALENAVDRFKGKYEREKEKTETLEQNIRLIRRSSHDNYRHRCQEQAEEIRDLLTKTHDQVRHIQELRQLVQDRDGEIQVQRTQLADKDRAITRRNRAIIYFKTYLRNLGYVVDSPV